MKLSEAIGVWKKHGLSKDAALRKAKAAVFQAALRNEHERWTTGRQKLFDAVWSGRGVSYASSKRRGNAKKIRTLTVNIK